MLGNMWKNLMVVFENPSYLYLHLLILFFLRSLYETVKNWFNELKRGRTSIFDDPRPGAPKIGYYGG